MNKEEISLRLVEYWAKQFTSIDISTLVNRYKYCLEEISKNENEELQQENKQLKEQLEYIRSGEYYNQLRFERDMLQDLVDKGEISKEDKKFIDCTHRNTELLEKIDKTIEILKGDSNE